MKSFPSTSAKVVKAKKKTMPPKWIESVDGRMERLEDGAVLTSLQAKYLRKEDLKDNIKLDHYHSDRSR